MFYIFKKICFVNRIHQFKLMKDKSIMIIAVVIVVLVVGTAAYMKLPKFGKIPKGERLERVMQSPHYKDGVFKNLSDTPQMTNENGVWGMIKDYYAATNKKPPAEIPSVKTNLKTLPKDKDVLVWFGHSSYLLQINGKTILVDPVFCGHASPFSFSIKAFDGTDVYSVEDMPAIDFLVITHDHWDHLDYETVKELKPKVDKVVTALGNGAHLESWGYAAGAIIEMDWYEKSEFDDGFVFHTRPARHFSGRGFIAKKALWASFVLETSGKKIFIGGDGGYDTYFSEIGKEFGEIDLAILENGQYNRSWKYIHLHPSEVLKAGADLNAERVFPVHSMKFALALHAWDTPLKTISELNEKVKIPLVTPLIGQVVDLNNPTQKFTNWWEEVKE